MKKMLGILICILFIVSSLPVMTNAETLNTLGCLGDPPYVPSNPNPENESTDIDIYTGLSWTGGDPDPGDTVRYDVYFGTDPNPPNVELKQLETTYDPGRLIYNTKYYWRIDAWDDEDFSTTGEVWCFSTADDNTPYLPSNPDPANDSTDVAANIDLSWTGGDPNPGDTVRYDVYFGTDPNPPNVVQKQLETTYDPGILKGDTQHYWRIDAWDDYGYSVTGEIWTFRTETQPDKPAKPDGPISGKSGTEYPYKTSTTDPDGDQVFYLFDWGDDTDSDWLGPYDSGDECSSSHKWTSQGDYQIRVKAKDTKFAESDWSDPLSISMPRNRPTKTLSQRILENLIQQSPLLAWLLQLPVFNR
jgi:hypothetical protein